MDGDGWVCVDELLKTRKMRGWQVKEPELKELVASNGKQRFALKEEGGKLFIRANQGHSIKSVKRFFFSSSFSSSSFSSSFPSSFSSSFPSSSLFLLFFLSFFFLFFFLLISSSPFPLFPKRQPPQKINLSRSPRLPSRCPWNNPSKLPKNPGVCVFPFFFF